MNKVMASKGIAIGVLIFILFVMIVYVIVMFELFKQQKFIFSPYTPPPPPPNSFYPLGTVTPMTPEEIEARNAIIRGSTSN